MEHSKGHMLPITGITSDSYWLYTASLDGTVREWQVGSWTQTACLSPTPLESLVDVKIDASHIYALSENARVFVFDRVGKQQVAAWKIQDRQIGRAHV